MRRLALLLVICFIAPDARAQVPPPPRPARVPPAEIVTPQRAEADFAFAASLADFHFRQGAVRGLGRIVQDPNHPRFRDAIVRLSRLSRELPEGADLERFFGAVTPPALATVADVEAQSGALYLLGKYRYDVESEDEAVAALSAVADRDPNKPRALFLVAAAAVRRRRSVPAVQAFQRALAALDAAPPTYDRAYLRDVALSATAQTFFSASVRPDENDAPTIDSSKLSAAVKYWEMLDTGSPLWPEAAYEMTWAFFLAGDISKADAMARLLASSAMPNAHATSARCMRALVEFSNCRYDEAGRQIVATRAFAAPLLAHLGATMVAVDALRRDDGYFELLIAVRDGRARVEPDAAVVVGRALADRAISRRMAYLAQLDGEALALARNVPFASTAGGAEARSAIDAERARVIGTISAAARERIETERSEIVERLEDVRRLEVDLAAAMRNQLDSRVADSLITTQESARNVVKPNDAFVWPFQRRLPDDVRRYDTFLFKTTVTSKCGR